MRGDSAPGGDEHAVRANLATPIGFTARLLAVPALSHGLNRSTTKTPLLGSAWGSHIWAVLRELAAFG